MGTFFDEGEEFVHGGVVGTWGRWEFGARLIDVVTCSWGRDERCGLGNGRCRFGVEMV